MSQTLAARLSALEARRSGQVFVVHGYSVAEHDARISELIALGRATENNLFVCILKSGERHVSAEAN